MIDNATRSWDATDDAGFDEQFGPEELEEQARLYAPAWVRF